MGVMLCAVILVVRVENSGFLLMGSVQVQARRLKSQGGRHCITNQYCITIQLFNHPPLYVITTVHSHTLAIDTVTQ